MSQPVFYAVIASLPTAALRAEYVAWLKGGHVDAVLRGGATVGEVIAIDPDPSGALQSPLRVMTRYEFPSRAAFDRYVQEFAPALRTDGVTRFGPATGTTYQRLVGAVQ